MKQTGLVDLRQDLRHAVLSYADSRRLRRYRDLAELDGMFAAIIEAAGAVMAAEAALGVEKEGSLHG